MKKKTKFLTILASLIGAATSFMGVAITSNSNNQTTLNANINAEKITKEFDAKLIGAEKGTITLTYTDVNDCTLSDISRKFLAKGHFDFNGGHFTSDGITYTITEIGYSVFSHVSGWYNYFFVESYITIPSTIKKIGINAFDGNSKNGLCWWSKWEIMGINFENGIETIAAGAFSWCDDIKQSTVVLPNSVKRLEHDCFDFNNLRTLDLSALDHVIDVDMNALSNGWEAFERGVLPYRLKTVYVKDEAMKAKYLADPRWYSDGLGTKIIKVK